MKKHYLFLLLAFGVAQAQIVNIPDPDFKAKLLAANPGVEIAINSLGENITIDSNNDGEVQWAEAAAVDTLIVNNSNIHDLTGIKAFTNLKVLACRSNHLTTLDVSGMSMLRHIACGDNNISEMNLEGIPLTILYCYFNNLTSLDLSSFTQLKELKCFSNPLTDLNFTGLSNLELLDISRTQITGVDLSSLTNLKQLFCFENGFNELELNGLNNLELLHCGSNNLASLDLTDQTLLETLICFDNHLSVLNLTNKPLLKKLSCGQNNLADLDLSDHPLLVSVECEDNAITNLDLQVVPTLKSLYCSNNLISNLDLSGLVVLEYVDCSGNQLQQLQINSNPQLKQLYCDDNEISTLDLSTMSGFPIISCNDNLLTELLLPPPDTYIEELHCSNNELTHLDNFSVYGALDISHNLFNDIQFNAEYGLSSFDCSYNYLTSLSMVDRFVSEFNCSHNQLAILSLGNFGCFLFDCSYNQLTNLDFNQTNENMESVPAVNVSHNNLLSLSINNPYYTFPSDDIPSSVLDISENPNLAYICANESSIPQLTSLVSSLGYNVEINNLCAYPPDVFFTIEGKQSWDVSGDGCDANDPPFSNVWLHITDGTVSGTWLSDTAGNYSVPAHEGTYTITPILSNVENYFVVSPESATVTFPGTSPFVQNFCIGPNGTHHDFEITVSPLTVALPGFDASYYVFIRNKGTQYDDISINLAYDDSLLDYVSATESVNVSSGNVIHNFSDVPPFATRHFEVTFNLNSPLEIPALNLGDSLIFTASVDVEGEETPYDNSFTLNQTVVNALDPNDKTCLEGNTIGPDMAGKYLHYLIRFENTGNYPAQIVTVEDMIDTTKFDISTLEPLDGSHAFTTRITGNKVEFIFNNIMLPFDDANNDGWVLFRIKTKPTLVLGDSVSNTAGIYFNFNPPVITNTATTTFATMGVDSHFDTAFTLWPNPADDVVNIESKRGEVITSVSVYNTLGQELLREKGSDLRRVNVSGLAAGTYIITIATDQSKSSTQLIKK